MLLNVLPEIVESKDEPVAGDAPIDDAAIVHRNDAAIERRKDAAIVSARLVEISENPMIDALIGAGNRVLFSRSRVSAPK